MASEGERRMDMQKFIDDGIKEMRQARLDNSSQLPLGDLIALLEPYANNQEKHIKEYGEEQKVQFDFAGCYPTGIGSWRGSYDELALSYKASDYGCDENMFIGDFVKLLKETIGKTFTGWKGGEFTMNEGTAVWIDNDGNCSHSYIVGVSDCYMLTLKTFCDKG